MNHILSRPNYRVIGDSYQRLGAKSYSYLNFGYLKAGGGAMLPLFPRFWKGRERNAFDTIGTEEEEGMGTGECAKMENMGTCSKLLIRMAVYGANCET